MSAHEGSKWQEEREARACPMHKVYDNNCSFCRDIREEAKPKPTPVETQEEAEQVFEYLSKTTCNKLRIPIDEAKKRIAGLYQLGILDFGNPDDPVTQIRIEGFLLVESKHYDHLVDPNWKISPPKKQL